MNVEFPKYDCQTDKTLTAWMVMLKLMEVGSVRSMDSAIAALSCDAKCCLG